jgi:ornithine carbamoyltransferase
MHLSDPMVVKSSCGVKGAKRVVVGTVTAEVFDSTADAVQFFGSDAAVTGLVNTQHATNIKNEARRLSNTKVSERSLEDKATKALTQDDEVLKRLLSLPKEEREAAMRQEIAKKVEELRAESDAARRAAVVAAGGAGEAEAEAEDDDDETVTD